MTSAKTTNERKTSQRQRDAAALDAFTKVIRNRLLECDSELITIPYKQNWREMMIWIRENFSPTRPA